MTLRENLRELGWYLTEEGVETLSENGQIQDVKNIVKKALDYDLREIGEASLPEDFTKDPTKLEAPVVLQIQKIRNVSAPKANEESTSAPRMLKLTLHDGKSLVTGLEVAPIPSISINTPPGTKILLKNEDLEVCHAVIKLTSKQITVLGGKVSYMIDKWELNRSLAKHTRGGIGADGGPPPWIPFGQRLETLSVEKQFKSLSDASKQENSEFDAQRKGAIAEAQRLSGIKKVFGGGTVPLLDANVQKIVDAGFTEEQAENALKFSKNNVDRALKMLQKRDNSENRSKEKSQKEPSEHPKRKGRNKEPVDEDSIPAKPTGKVSLFDFLEDKLPCVPDRDRNSRQDNYGSNERDRGGFFGRDRNGAKSNSRNQNSRYDNSNRGRNDKGYSNENYAQRDDRKYQTQNEKPPRFQRKQEERNKQQLQQQQQQQQQLQHQQQINNVNLPYSSYPPVNQYSDRNMRGDRSLGENKPHYRNHNSIDGLVEATAHLNLMGNQRLSGYPPPDQYAHKYGAGSRDVPPFPRNDLHKYPESSYRRPQHNGGSNYGEGAMNALGSGMNGAFGGAYGGGGVLGFQHAAVNEQARALLGGCADLPWKVGDHCLAHYWEDNNFYEAEITGISANTVVVKFCAYGNHEEILKSNCLPLPNPGSSSAGYGAARRA